MKNAIVIVGFSLFSLNSFAVSKMVCTVTSSFSSSSSGSSTSSSSDSSGFYASFSSGSVSNTVIMIASVTDNNNAVLSRGFAKNTPGSVVTLNPDVLKSAEGAKLSLGGMGLVVLAELKVAGNQQVSVRLVQEKSGKEYTGLMTPNSPVVAVGDATGARITMTCEIQ